MLSIFVKAVLAFIVICICGISSCHAQQKNENVPHGDDHDELPCCSVDVDKPDRKLILVSTLNGRLSMLDGETGRILWIRSTGPGSLLSSSISNYEFHNGQWYRIVPSLDGMLFGLTQKSVEALPYNAESLLQSSVHLSEDTVITGGKELRTYAIGRWSGRLHYVCTVRGCQQFPPKNLYDEEDLIMVQRETQTIRATEPLSGLERWNFSVGYHIVKVLNPLKGGTRDERSNIRIDPMDSLLRFSVPDGKVMLQKPTGVLWEKDLKSPITQAWKIRGQNLEPVDLFPFHKWINEGGSPLYYLGKHDNQLYIQNVMKGFGEGALVPSSITAIQKHGLSISIPSISWEEYNLALPPLISNEIKQDPGTDKRSETTAIAVLDSESSDVGFFIYATQEQEEMEAQSECTKGNASSNDTTVSDSLEEPSLWQEPQVVIIGLWFWWKEIMVISVVTALAFHFAITRPALHFIHTRVEQETWVRAQKYLRFIHQPKVVIVERPASTHNGKGSSNSSTSSNPSSIIPSPSGEFHSRFEEDFQNRIQLGKGGFGVVFKAQNCLDDCYYAIKRIRLPNSEQSRQKVLREVKALAKLKHHSIVRYYNAWTEQIPPGWKLGGMQIVSTSGYKSDALSKEEEQTSSVFTSRNTQLAISQTSEGLQMRVPLPNNDSVTSDGGVIFDYDGADGNIQSIEQISTPIETHSESEQDLPVSTPASTSVIFLYIQMELCCQETLKDWLTKVKKPEVRVQQMNHIFHQIVDAVRYIHSQGLIHRDLKPSNILFDEQWQVKVSDFGLVLDAPALETGRSTSNPVGQYTNPVGTRLYMSPEQLQHLPIGHHSDIYTLGLIYLEMILPFGTEMERSITFSEARQSLFPQELDGHPVELDLIKRMLAKDPLERPEAKEILSLPLFDPV